MAFKGSDHSMRAKLLNHYEENYVYNIEKHAVPLCMLEYVSEIRAVFKQCKVLVLGLLPVERVS